MLLDKIIKLYNYKISVLKSGMIIDGLIQYPLQQGGSLVKIGLGIRSLMDVVHLTTMLTPMPHYKDQIK